MSGTDIALRNRARVATVAAPALPSPRKEAVGEGGNEGNFDEQPKDGFACGEPGQRISQTDACGKEPAAMKGTDAEHERLIPPQVRRRELSVEQISACEGEDDQDIGGAAPQRTVAVASDEP